MIAAAKKRSGVRLSVPKVFEPLFTCARRRNYLYGGRGSAKSHSVAQYCVLRAYTSKVKILCTRELQKSISESVHALLCDKIEQMGLSDFFTIYKDRIVGANGSLFVFAGVRQNVGEIKSMEGIDVCWVEEAQSMSRTSIDVLVPTVRAEGSVIIFTFNPFKDTDPVYVDAMNPDDDWLVIKANYTDNPFFPEVLRREMEFDRKMDYDKYLWVWEGECLGLSEAQVFRGKYEVREFDTPPNAEFHLGADWGFACLDGDTLVSTDMGSKRLRHIRPGDRVLTRKGYKKVLFFKNKGRKKVFDLDCGYGKRIIITGDHKVFTADGWKRADELGSQEVLCEKKLSSMGEFIDAIRRASTRIISTTSLGTRANSTESFIGTFTSSIKALSQKGMSFITLTATLLTTALRTCFAALLPSTARYTSSLSCTRTLLTEQGLSTVTARRIGRSAGRSLWLRRRIEEERARNAESLTRLLTCIRNTAVRIAASAPIRALAKWSIPARCAARSLWLRLTTSETLVLRSARIRFRALNEEREVFDIAVEDCHEFVANGVLVHNCDPTVIIRSFVMGNTLYIDQCAGKVGCDIDDTPELFDRVEGTAVYPIYADSARPETISFMRTRRYNVIPCDKWNGSVEDGIQYLRSFSKIVIHPRCKDVVEEFDLYQYKVDRQTGEVLREPVDKYNHYIDALRYSHVVTMRAGNNGKVYPEFTMDCVKRESPPSGMLYFGSMSLPGRILWVVAEERSGTLVAVDAFAQNVIDFARAAERFPSRCPRTWMPMETLRDIQQNYVADCMEADFEPAVPSVLPADGEGSKLVNDLFSRRQLFVSESAFTLVSCLNERVFLPDGKVERSSKEQENVRMCRLFEYLVWRVVGRLGGYGGDDE